MYDLQKISEECIKKIRDIGIPVQDDKIVEIKFARTNAQGRCILTTEGEYYIRISPIYNDEKIDICELESTVIHELLHTCPDSIRHNTKWMEYAEKVRNVYGYDIFSQKTTYDLRHKDKPVLHRMKCPKCIGYWDVKEQRAWKMIQAGEKCYCGLCRCEYVL